MVRLFIAAWPSADVIERLAELRRPIETGVRWVPAENWHITLRFIGDTDLDDIASRLNRAVLPRAVARLGPAVGRLGGRQLVIPAEGVDALAEAVCAATAGIGHVDRHRFRGHLTIARLEPGARSSIEATTLQAQFEIAEVAVVTSELLPTGAVYTTVATFPTA